MIELNGHNNELSESCGYPLRSDSMDIMMSFRIMSYPLVMIDFIIHFVRTPWTYIRLIGYNYAN